MKCQHCQNNEPIYVMSCIGCAARHCRMLYYPEGMNKWAYVEAVAKKYKHDKTALAEKIKESVMGGKLK